jgi:hypothetical protein
MLLEGIVAASFLGLGCAIIGADSRLGRSAAYTIHQWRRRARARRRTSAAPAAERLTR